MTFFNFSYPTAQHWNYYLAVEEDLVNTSKFVEIHEDNFKTFSTEYTKIILTACSEVDVLFKEISICLGNNKENPNFGDYCEMVKSDLDSLIDERLHIRQYSLDIYPYKKWVNGCNKDNKLGWHEAYNSLKHNRSKHYKKGNLENALESVAALFITVIQYYRCLVSKKSKKASIHNVLSSLNPKNSLITFPIYQYY